MIGNDIVDLKVAALATRWNNQRFIEKVFSNSEQEILSKAKDSFKIIWIFWSMKESAYKVHLRRCSKRFFAPRKLECRLVSSRDGIVTIGHEKYFTSGLVYENYIYTLAYENDPGIHHRIQSKCFPIDEASYSNQHAECYHHVIQDLSGEYKTHNRHFSIKKNKQGVPFIYKDDIKLPIVLSITHHGLFCAYAYVKN